MSGYVAATSPVRRRLWERVLGSERVPVLDVRPRWVEFRDGPAWGYDVAVRELHDGQVCRLAAYMSRVNRTDYDETRRSILDDGVVVVADGLYVVDDETADAGEHRPFRFGGLRWLGELPGRVLWRVVHRWW